MEEEDAPEEVEDVPQTPSAAEVLMGETPSAAKGGKSAGRDYLMELLKK